MWAMTLSTIRVTNEQVAAWCLDAVTILEGAGLTPDLAALQREIIVKFADKTQLQQIAADLAEGLNDLSDEGRAIVDDALKQAHGFGLSFFLMKKGKALRKILMRGSIKTDKNLVDALDAVSDMGMDDQVAMQLSSLIAEYGKNKRTT